MFSDISVVITNNEKIMDFKKLWVVKLRTTQKTHNEWNSPNCYEIYRWCGERQKCESLPWKPDGIKQWWREKECRAL